MTAYVRLAPFNKETGHLARRHCVHTNKGGKLFEERKWYVMQMGQAVLLKDIKQGTGANMFEVHDLQSYQETARRELAAEMAARGGMVYTDQIKPPAPVKAPKEGPAKSRFDGLAVSEVPQGSTMQAAAHGGVDDADAGDDPSDDADDNAEAPVETETKEPKTAKARPRRRRGK